MTKQKSYDILWWTLVSSDQAVEQAIINLYHQQTKDEQGNHQTRYANSRGFSSAHAKIGSMYAEQVINGLPLNEEQVCEARKIALHYVKQIVNLSKSN